MEALKESMDGDFAEGTLKVYSMFAEEGTNAQSLNDILKDILRSSLRNEVNTYE